jgi:hypothetical protein
MSETQKDEQRVDVGKSASNGGLCVLKNLVVNVLMLIGFCIFLSHTIDVDKTTLTIEILSTTTRGIAIAMVVFQSLVVNDNMSRLRRNT